MKIKEQLSIAWESTKKFVIEYKLISFYLFLFALTVMLSSVLIKQSQTSESHAASLVSPGLVAAYGFDEGSGAIINDMTGNNPGVEMNASWIAGKFGNSLSFNGSNAFIAFNNSPSLDFSGNTLTLSLWLNPQLVSGDTVVLGKFWNPTMTAPYYQYGLELQNGNSTPVFQIGTSAGVKIASMSKKLPMNQWTHLAVVFNGSQVKFYKNGTLVTTRPMAATITARGQQMRIGSDNNGSQFYKGLIDEVRIYNRALSQTEIVSDMKGSLAPSGVPTVTPTPTSGVVPSSSPTPTVITPTTVPPTGTSLTGCESNPAKCGYPDATNTGVPVGTALTRYDGDFRAATPGQEVKNLDIYGCITVSAPKVYIHHVKIHCGFLNGVNVVESAASSGLAQADWTRVEDTEIICGSNAFNGIANNNLTVRRVRIGGCENGFSLDNNADIQDSYVSDVNETGGNHGDAIQFGSPTVNIVIRHNTLFAHNATAAVNQTEASTSMLVENNLLAGGSYTIYCPTGTVGSAGYRVINNRFGTYTYGHAYPTCHQPNDGEVWSGNYLDSNLSSFTP